MAVASSSRTLLQVIPKSTRSISTRSTRKTVPTCRYCLNLETVVRRTYLPQRSYAHLTPGQIKRVQKNILNIPVPSFQLPTAYTYYPKHNDVPLTPLPEMAKVYESDIYPPHVPRDSVFNYLWPQKEKGEIAEFYPRPDPQSIAFIDGITGRRLYREEIPTRSMWLSSGMRKNGFQRGDTACIFGQNSLEWVEANFAIQALTSITSPANYAYTAQELLHQLKDSDAKFCFVQPSLVPVLEEALKMGAPDYKLASNRIVLLCQFADKPEGSPYRTYQELWEKQAKPKFSQGAGDEKRTAYLCYSSGTTGKAKGVETSHHNLCSQLQTLGLAYEQLSPANKDVILGILPFSHIYGLTLLVHHPMTRSVPVVVLPKFDEKQVLEVVEKFKITWMLVVPPVMLALSKSQNIDSYDLTSLRGMMTGAAPCSPELMKAVQARFPVKKPAAYGLTTQFQSHVRISQGYGLTETSPVSHVMTLEEAEAHPGKIGKVVPLMQARLVDIESGEDVQEVGARGELWLRGACVMKGYWKNPEATAATFAPGGWFKTGDVATVDADGYFEIVDRVKELIKYKGFQVPPAELESLLLTHPSILDVGVIGVWYESEVTEKPRAYITTTGRPVADRKPAELETLAENINAWLKGKVAPHKQLRGGIRFIDVVPKSPSGKILRRELRELSKAEDAKATTDAPVKAKL